MDPLEWRSVLAGFGGPAVESELDLERFRPYLNLMARLGLAPLIQAKIAPSDVVQNTIIEAHRNLDRFRGRAVEQQLALLRKMLASNLAKAGRDLRRQKRDVEREQSLEASIERSSKGLLSVLPAPQSSPSDRAMKNEALCRVADALERLPEAQREAVLLHYADGLTTREIAERMERTKGSVAGLLMRGLERMRESIGNSF